MAITLFTPTQYTASGSSATHDISHNSDVTATFIRVTVAGIPTLPVINSVVWDPAGANQAFTLIGSRLDNADGRSLAEYGLASPSSSGTKLARITFATSIAEVVAGAQSASGVDTATPTSGFQSFPTTGAGDTSPTNLPAVSSATGDVVVDACCFAFGQTITPDGTQTVDLNFNDTNFGAGRLGTSHKDGAASVTMQWTFTGTQDYCTLGYSLKAAAGGGGGTAYKIGLRTNLRPNAFAPGLAR